MAPLGAPDERRQLFNGGVATNNFIAGFAGLGRRERGGDANRSGLRAGFGGAIGATGAAAAGTGEGEGLVLGSEEGEH